MSLRIPKGLDLFGSMYDEYQSAYHATRIWHKTLHHAEKSARASFATRGRVEVLHNFSSAIMFH